MKKASIYSKTQRQLRRELVDALALSRARQEISGEPPPDGTPDDDVEMMEAYAPPIDASVK